MAVNKVIYDDNTLIDLTGDTLTSGNQLLNGITAHSRSGNLVTGSVVIQTFYTGTETPSSAFGNNGDLYLKLVE